MEVCDSAKVPGPWRGGLAEFTEKASEEGTFAALKWALLSLDAGIEKYPAYVERTHWILRQSLKKSRRLIE